MEGADHATQLLNAEVQRLKQHETQRAVRTGSLTQPGCLLCAGAAQERGAKEPGLQGRSL